MDASIITDNDVWVTGSTSVIGEKLRDVLDEQQKTIDQLKGNVKWIYKYGGVGSGSGGSGGGGGSSKMSVSATLNNTPINRGNVIQLSQDQTSYEFRITVAGGGNYNATITWGDNKSTVLSLSSNNNWTAKYTMVNITKNGTIDVLVSDGTGGMSEVYASYIVNPYSVEKLIAKDIYGNTYTSYPYINIRDAATDKGVVFSSQYEISIDAKIQYYWIVPEMMQGETPTGSEDDPLESEDKKSSLSFPIPTDSLVSRNAGDYDMSLHYRIVPKSGSVTDWKTIGTSFSLIPDELYLAISSEISNSVYDYEIATDTFTTNVDSSAEIENRNYFVSEPFDLEPGDVVYHTKNDSTALVNFAFTDYSKSGLLCETSNDTVYYRNTTTGSIRIRLVSSVAVYNEPYVIVSESQITPYSVNRSIGIYGRIFAGAVSGNTGTINYKLDSDRSYSLTVTDGKKYYLPNIIFTKPGWHKIYFTYSFPYQGAPKEGTPFSKFVYVSESSSELNWFKNKSNILETNYFRFDNEKTTIDDLYKNTVAPTYDEKYATDTTSRKVVIQNIPDGATNTYDTFINIGFQYSDTNDLDQPIFNIITTSSQSGDNNIFTVYNDKITYKDVNKVINFTCHREKDYDPSDSTKYHLLTINYRCVDATSSQDVKRELCVYMDGVMEGVWATWETSYLPINKIEINNVNVAYNLLEVDYVKIIEEKSQGVSTFYPSIADNDIVFFYYSYLVKSNNNPELVSEEKMKLMKIFFDDTTHRVNYTLDKETSLLKIDKSTYETLVGTWSDVTEKSGLHVMVASSPRIDDYHKKDIIKDWMNVRYNEGSSSSEDDPRNYKIPVNLEWGILGKGISDPLKNVEYKYQGETRTVSELTQFTLKLQGSSTLRYKAKNFTLGFNWKSGFEQDVIPVFSPNYNVGDEKTFLPETSFTLKADVVDSAHTNNTAVGEFVNDYSDWNIEMGQSGLNTGFIKKCLTGFPFLMILKTTGATDADTEYFILGVYNFNLGRDSYFNLGYCLNSKLDGISTAADDSFAFKAVDGVDVLPKFIAAEVQGNAKYWDFSQYDLSILFSKFAGDSGYYMFDDIVKNKNNTTSDVAMQNFVKNISNAGGYLFNEIGKNFVPVGTDSSLLPYYHIHDTVPDNTHQYERSSKDVYVDKGVVSESHGTESDLEQCLLQYQVGEVTEDPYLHYNSALYYYLICMAFGLVDSVQKNLNIKTWNNKTFGIFFYDMDTCLGIDNGGAFTSYFCFSDYWETITSSPQQEVIEGKTVDVYEIDVNNCKIWRDFYPISGVESGFDIPSSYLYAIPKYTSSVKAGSTLFGSLKNAATLWAQWRSVENGTEVERGPLATADDFIDNYYAKHLSPVAEILMDLNYRNKYLAETNDEGTGYNDNTSSALHGRNIERTREWLNSRLHVMDGYFNLFSHGDGALTLYGNYNEAIPDVNAKINHTANEDVYVYRDIFNSTNVEAMKRNGDLSFILKAKSNSPLIILDGNVYKRMFIEDDQKYYRIRYSYGGSSNSRFGGSPLWTYLDSINSFINTIPSSTKFYLSSKNITNVSGTDGRCTAGMEINTLNAKKISLNSTGYSGELKIDSRYKNLGELDLSDSTISLILQDDGGQDISLRSLNLNNLGKSGSPSEVITINNTPNLNSTSVKLSNAYITQCNIYRSWMQNMNLSNTKIISSYVMASYPNSTFTITNNNTIKSLTLTGFCDIRIENCPSLETVYLISSEEHDASVKSIVITNCASLETFGVGCKFSDTFTTLNLSGCVSLTNMSLVDNGSSYNGIKTLNLSGIKIKTISWANPKSGLRVTDSSILDMTPFTSLEKTTNAPTCSFTDMGAVEYIRFKNDVDNPINISSSFQGCSKLKRIFGCVNISHYTAFYNCSEFSIHGTDLETMRWYPGNNTSGLSVIDSNYVVKPPFAVIGDCSTGTTEPNLAYDDPLVRMKKYFQTENISSSPKKLVTNMYFKAASYGAIFYNTKYTLFDAYYFLSMLTRATSLGASFEMTTIGNYKYGRFYWNPTGITQDVEGQYYMHANCDNSPNRYMFAYTPQLTNINSLFYNTTHSSVPTFDDVHYYRNIKLYSPTTDTDGIVIKNDGLFSYLPKLSTFSLPFYGTNPYIDRFLFRKKHGDTSKNVITYIGYFNPSKIVSNVNTMTSSPEELKKDNKNLFGNMKDFFEDFSKLETVFGSFNGTEYIDYVESKKFPLPSTVKFIRASFSTKYGNGEIKLNNLFTSNSNGLYITEEIVSSFMISSKLEDDVYCTFNIQENMFENYPNIVKIGHNDASGDYRMTSGQSSSFNGTGVIKKIIGESFPYNIISTNKKLKMFSGFFMNSSFAGSVPENIKLPSDMFSGLTQMTDISALFWNVKFNYKLSDINNNFSNFKDCKNLQRCDYAFGEEAVQATPHLSGSIPYMFFYHGGTRMTIAAQTGFDVSTYDAVLSYDASSLCKYNKRIYMCKEPVSHEEFNPSKWLVINSGDVIPSAIEESIKTEPSFTYEKVNATITDMSYCFSHTNTEAYSMDLSSQTPQIDVEEMYIKHNPSFSPFDFFLTGIHYDPTTDTSTFTYSHNDNKDVSRYTYAWAYDGLFEHRPNATVDAQCEHLDDVVDSSLSGYTTISNIINIPKDPDTSDHLTYLLNYSFPPDLMRYCTDSASLSGLFNGSGSMGWKAAYSGNHVNLFQYGMTGRLCPYMFRPVSKTTRLDSVFAWCRRLSGYATANVSTGEIKSVYIIPQDLFSYLESTQTMNLIGMFQGLMAPQKTDINVFKKMKSKNANVESLFYRAWWGGVSDEHLEIKNIFANSTGKSDGIDVNSTKYCFAASTAIGGTEDFPHDQYVKFVKVFKGYNTPIYQNNQNYSYTFNGYDSSTVIHEIKDDINNATVPTNASLYNYKCWNKA